MNAKFLLSALGFARLGVLSAAICFLVAGCGDSSRHSTLTSGVTVRNTSNLRQAVLEGAQADFQGTAVREPYIRCFLPKLRLKLTGAELGMLVETYRERGQALAARRLNALAAGVGDACGGRRFVPELVGASRAVAGSRGCPTTRPNGSRPPGERASDTFYGERGLWTVLPLDGVLRVTETTPVAPGATFGKVYADGSLSTKFAWWGSRSAGSQLTIRGKRLDGRGRQLRLTVGPGATAGSPHFWPTRLRFARPGCWRVTGRSGHANLAFTISVRRAES
jgi:hypothetical protein